METTIFILMCLSFNLTLKISVDLNINEKTEEINGLLPYDDDLSNKVTRSPL